MTSPIKACYRSGGELAGQDVPCDPNATTSACCGVGSVCMENYYCQDSNGYKIPGTCTDQLWGVQRKPTPECPCLPHYTTDGSVLNYRNSVTFCPDGSLCCGIDNFDCCNSGTGNPRIQYRNSNVVPSGTASLRSYYAGVTVTTVPVTRNLVAVSTSASTSISASASTSSSMPTSNADARGVVYDLSPTAKIGIGIGVGIAVLLLAGMTAISIVMWKRLSNLKAQRQVEQQGLLPKTLGRHEVPVNGSQIVEVPGAVMGKHVWSRNLKPAELDAERRGGKHGLPVGETRWM